MHFLFIPPVNTYYKSWSCFITPWGFQGWWLFGLPALCLSSHFLQLRLKACVQWEHCTFIRRDETETPLSMWPAVCALCKPSEGFKLHLSYSSVGALHGPWQWGTTIWCAGSFLWRCGCTTGRARQLRKGRTTFYLYSTFHAQGETRLPLVWWQ